MDDDQAIEQIFGLLIDDIEDQLSEQKGKQPAGTFTALEVALLHQREQILALQASARDRRLALSTGTAITTDQNLLSTNENGEGRAEQDHRYALSLSNGRSITQGAPSPSTTAGVMSLPSNDDAVSTTMEDLIDRLMLDDKPDNGEGSSRYVSSPRPRTPSPEIECNSCFEKCDAILFEGPCRHKFCRDCTRQMFLGAIKDEELYPPRCCGNALPPETALRTLDYEELQAFSEKGVEYSAKDRIYCADPVCSKFIPPLAVENEHGTCPKCHQQTHVPCSSLAHPGTDCPLDEALQNVLTIAKNEKWKQCSNCQTMVELYRGCNRIICRCGRQFCYTCGNVWKTCQCPLWEESGITGVYDRALELAPGIVVMPLNIVNWGLAGRANYQPVACAHNLNTQWRYCNRGNLRCQLCQHELPKYIFVCNNCQMRACFRCRMHWFR